MDVIDPLEVADDLKREASELISSTGLDRILNSYGEVLYTGSYYLDTMVWPDLDIDIRLHRDPYSIEAFFQLGCEIARLRGVKSLKFANALNSADPKINRPKGLYWKVRVARPGNGVPWKVDLWAFDEVTFEKQKKQVSEFAAKIDSNTRKRIIELKHSFLTTEGRTPVFCGHHIYHAVLLHGIEDRPGIIKYLREHGVELEEE